MSKFSRVAQNISRILKQYWQKLKWHFCTQKDVSCQRHTSTTILEKTIRPIQYYAEKSNLDELPFILILTPVKDAAKFLPQYLEKLLALTYPRKKISIGFLESDSIDNTFEYLQESIPRLEEAFRKVSLYQRNYNFQTTLPRWDTSIQFLRRSILAKSRNYLMHKALEDETWVLWLDVDVSKYPIDVIQQLLATKKEIVVPHCVFENNGSTFDLNTFKFKLGTASRNWSVYAVDGIIQSPRGLGRWYLEDLQDYDIIEVDGVGGTLLFIWADLLREGLSFPPYSYKGYIETEGLAIMAKDMGYSCWGLPHLKVTHGDH